MLKGNCGDAPYRHHPSTIRELNDYFNQLAKEASTPTFNYSQFLRQGHLPLLAKLIQDSQKPTAELLAELKEILLPIGSSFASLCSVEIKETAESKESVVDSSIGDASEITDITIPITTATTSTASTKCFINHHFLNEFFEKTSYGHPQCTAPFTAWSCTFWQVKEMSLLGPELSKHFLVNFVMRQAARMILEGAFAELDENDTREIGKETDTREIAKRKIGKETDTRETDKDTANEIANSFTIPPTEPSVSQTTKKSSKKRKVEAPSTPSKPASPTKPSPDDAPTPTRKQPQISAFFSKLERKKESFAAFTPGEYFQPFFLKPDTTLAPINSLRTDAVEVEIRELKRSRTFRKERCLCVGMDGVATRAVLKLLRFEENYRPAYVGTWRRSASSTVTGRRPFGRVEEVDYEYDSDEEWEGVEGEEGESLSSDDEEEDEEEEEGEEVMSSNESEDSWLVPHGYLSDDEGVADEIHLGELEEKEAMAMPPVLPKKRKKFIPKEPFILGPFFEGCSSPCELIKASPVQFLNSEWAKRGPFDGYLETVFAHLLSDEATAKAKQVKEFPEPLILSLIKVVQDNQMAGIVKLYDEFTLLNGKCVSKRAFESKLNQLTIGKQKCPITGKMKWTFKEGIISPIETVQESETVQGN